MATDVLFENKLIKTKNIEKKRNTVECFVTALDHSSKAPHYFL